VGLVAGADRLSSSRRNDHCLRRANPALTRRLVVEANEHRKQDAALAALAHRLAVVVDRVEGVASSMIGAATDVAGAASLLHTATRKRRSSHYTWAILDRATQAYRLRLAISTSCGSLPRQRSSRPQRP
jgi:hypothetical protein